MKGDVTQIRWKSLKGMEYGVVGTDEALDEQDYRSGRDLGFRVDCVWRVARDDIGNQGQEIKKVWNERTPKPYPQFPHIPFHTTTS